MLLPLLRLGCGC